MKKFNTIALALGAATALSACATLEESIAEETATTYRATLTGNGVVGSGDMDGFATGELSISDSLDQVCYDINDVRGLGPITGAHIHRGGPTVNGPVVFALEANDEGGWSDCVELSEWTEEAFESNPTGYYFQIHTTEYPGGAIRGQIRND